jgi:hypothetical protein
LISATGGFIAEHPIHLYLLIFSFVVICCRYPKMLLNVRVREMRKKKALAAENDEILCLYACCVVLFSQAVHEYFFSNKVAVNLTSRGISWRRNKSEREVKTSKYRVKVFSPSQSLKVFEVFRVFDNKKLENLKIQWLS